MKKSIRQFVAALADPIRRAKQQWWVFLSSCTSVGVASFAVVVLVGAQEAAEEVLEVQPVFNSARAELEEAWGIQSMLNPLEFQQALQATKTPEELALEAQARFEITNPVIHLQAIEPLKDENTRKMEADAAYVILNPEENAAAVEAKENAEQKAARQRARDAILNPGVSPQQ